MKVWGLAVWTIFLALLAGFVAVVASAQMVPPLAKWVGMVHVNGEPVDGSAVIPYDASALQPLSRSGYQNPPAGTQPAFGLYAVSVFSHAGSQSVIFKVNGNITDQQPSVWEMGGFFLLNLSVTDSDNDGYPVGYLGYPGGDRDCDDANPSVRNDGFSDYDNDGVANCKDDDDDGDGVIDEQDKLQGTCADMGGNLAGVDCSIGEEESGEAEGIQKIEIKKDGEVLVGFTYNFSSPLDWFNVSIVINETDAGAIVVRGIILPEGQTKNVTFPKVNDITSVCIKDAEVESIANVSATCLGEHETALQCPGINGNYSCSFTDETKSRFRVSGLRHSAVKQQAYCGDGTINVPGEECDGSDFGGLSCSSFNLTSGSLSCSSSCIISDSACSSGSPSPPSSSGQQGGAGGSGGSSQTQCTYQWDCTEWSSCSPQGEQARQCTNRGTCTGTAGKPAQVQSCTPPPAAAVPVFAANKTVEPASGSNLSNNASSAPADSSSGRKRGFSLFTGGIVSALQSAEGNAGVLALALGLIAIGAVFLAVWLKRR